MSILPQEFSACSVVVSSVGYFFMDLFHSLNFHLLLENLETSAMMLMMQEMGKGSDVTVAFASHDFYRLGGDVGDMINMIIDLGIAKDAFM